MIKFAVENIKKQYLTNTATKEYGLLEEAILFDTDMLAYIESRKTSKRTVIRPVQIWAITNVKSNKVLGKRFRLLNLDS